MPNISKTTELQRERKLARQRHNYKTHREQELARGRVYHKTHKEQIKKRRVKYLLTLTGEQRERRKEHLKTYRKIYKIKNKEKIAKYDREYRQKHKKEHLECSRIRIYGVTKEMYDKMAMKQENKCLICGNEFKLYVDHCHKTKEIRGLLCMKCNVGLGNFKDSISNLENAIKYLRRD